MNKRISSRLNYKNSPLNDDINIKLCYDIYEYLYASNNIMNLHIICEKFLSHNHIKILNNPTEVVINNIYFLVDNKYIYDYSEYKKESILFYVPKDRFRRKEFKKFINKIK